MIGAALAFSGMVSCVLLAIANAWRGRPGIACTFVGVACALAALALACLA